MPIYMLFSPIITPPTSELTKDGNIAIVQLCYLARRPIPVYVNFVCHCLWSVKLNPDTTHVKSCALRLNTTSTYLVMRFILHELNTTFLNSIKLFS